MMIRSAFSIAALFAGGLVAQDCKPGSKKTEEPPPPPSNIPSATTPVPQAMPVADFDASMEPLEGKSPLETARIYESRGQDWMAQMALEKKAFGPDGTKHEIEFLAFICHKRDDEECLKKCELKLGKKLHFDGGAPRGPIDAGRDPNEHKSDVAKARDYILKKEWDAARPLLEPKVLEGKASKEEIRLLKQVCKEQGDRMCVALCDAKLK
jgi:hypothetical protein